MSDPNELTENEKELLEAMKAAPENDDSEAEAVEESESDAEEVQADGSERDERGRFKPKQKAEEQAEPEEAEPEPEEKHDRTVPLTVLMKERQRRSESEEQLRALREELSQLRETITPPQPERADTAPDEMPDPVLDPAGFKSWMAAQHDQAVAPLRQQREQQERAAKIQQAHRALTGYASQAEDAFRKEYPDRDYDAALDFARQRAVTNARLFGVPDEKIGETVAQQEAQLVAQAYRRGVSPAALLWNYALQNGFQERPAEQEDRIERLALTERKTRSVGSAAGRPREGDISLESVARMTDEEFAKLPPEKLEQIMAALGR